ncbi:uncharacterized protein METZ01_LOCUS253719 [marine metagenome]|uniref:Uncharacterized protein n=1 Tax=marine metagenome TaxID=408172 RepID=A0A382INC6_9ZZZZ
MSIYHLGVTSSVVSELSGASTKITQQPGESSTLLHLGYFSASSTQQTSLPFI